MFKFGKQLFLAAVFVDQFVAQFAGFLVVLVWLSLVQLVAKQFAGFLVVLVWLSLVQLVANLFAIATGTVTSFVFCFKGMTKFNF